MKISRGFCDQVLSFLSQQIIQAQIIRSQFYKQQSIKINKIYWYEHKAFNDKMSQKIKVKKLENSPYVIAPQQVLGKGSFSVIVRAYNLENPKEDLVAKIISVKDAETSITIKSQLQILKKLPHHLNLVNCMKFQISSENNFYLIMEYCNEGNLDKYMVRRNFKIPEQKIWFFLKQFCQGYKVLYNNGIVHRDIKPENILIHNGDFKIADFGLSKNVEDMEVISNMSSKGTPLYMAPEIHLQKEGSSKVDVFSLGVVLYKMAFDGQYPFFDQNRKYRSVNEYFKQLMVRKLMIPSAHKRSPVLVRLIESMLTKDKEKRISWKEIFELQEVKNAIRYERKKQLAPMEELRRSLMIVNKSQTFVNIIETSNSNSEANQDDSSSIILQETFNKKNKSTFQKVLFKSKLLYTLIQYTNKRMDKFMKRTGERMNEQALVGMVVKDEFVEKYSKLFKYVIKQMGKIVQEGILYSLYVISRLEQVSGDWSQLNEGEIMNFEDIFENDKGIFLQQYKQLKTAKQPKEDKVNNQGKETQQYKTQKQEQPNNPALQVKQASTEQQQSANCISEKYQDGLYKILNEYFEYPKQVRSQQLRSIFTLLLNIYDLAIKSETTQEQPHSSECLQVSKNLVQKAQDETTLEFYQYLMDIETVDENALKEQMKKKGLVFL